jgi:hypothetical protein
MQMVGRDHGPDVAPSNWPLERSSKFLQQQIFKQTVVVLTTKKHPIGF